MNKPVIKNSSGDNQDHYSDTCPECMGSAVTKEVSKTADFDDTGNWFYPINFECQSQKCLHKWKEKFMVRQ